MFLGINLDLLTVGISVAGTGILGFVVYFSNKKSITNKIFFIFSIVTLIWGVVNYLNYQTNNDFLILWTIRFVIFFAVLQALSFFALMFVFPKDTIIFPRWFKIIVMPATFAVALLTLTPFVFSSITKIPGDVVSHPVPAPGIFVFVFTAVLLVIVGFIIILKKLRLAQNELHLQIKLIIVGVLTMFTMIILFNLILPIIFKNTRYIPLGAFFTFPFVIFTSIAILKQHLFNVKVVATAVLVFILSIVLFLEIIFADSFALIIFRSSVFFLVLVFGINLIRSVVKEVKQRERLEVLTEELSEANEKLKGLDKLKTEFVSLASHQLRSPLTAIKGYTSMLLDGDYGTIDTKAKEAVDRIMESSNNLTLVVEDLLNVTKIEQGGMKYKMTKFDFGELTRDTTKDLSITAEKKGLKLIYNIPDDKKYFVNGDKEKLRQVLINIIDNGMKYTKEGQIEVSLRLEKEKVILSIKDTGVGISPDIIKTLFKKFSRGDRAELNTSGSGLGLYLVREIIDAHHGRVWVESEGLGKGSTFFVELNEEK